MSINVNRDVEDVFYRYKMPKLMAKVIGRGNGIKTEIVNMQDIAKALSRKAIYPTKYFGCELGTQIGTDAKNDRYIVNGVHEVSKLQELLHGFIKKFVLCQQCDNPETLYTVRAKKNGGTVLTKCRACGHADTLDPRHRLTQFILKNPPTTEADGAAPKTDHVNGIPGSVSGGRHKGSGSGGESPTDDGDDAGGSNGDDDDVDTGIDDDDWLDEASEEAQRLRIEALPDAVRAMALDGTAGVVLEKTQAEKADCLFELLKRHLDQGDLLECRVEIKKEADALGLQERSIVVVMEAVLSRGASIQQVQEDVDTYRPLLLLFTRVGDSVDRSQRYALGAMEKTLERFGLGDHACHLLKALYDADVVQEESIFEWFDKGPTKRFVSKDLSRTILSKCQPMVDWLRDAEEESDENEEEPDNDDDLKDIFQPTKQLAHPPSRQQKNCEEEDDIDIDAI